LEAEIEEAAWVGLRVAVSVRRRKSDEGAGAVCSACSSDAVVIARAWLKARDTEPIGVVVVWCGCDCRRGLGELVGAEPVFDAEAAGSFGSCPDVNFVEAYVAEEGPVGDGSLAGLSGGSGSEYDSGSTASIDLHAGYRIRY